MLLAVLVLVHAASADSVVVDGVFDEPAWNRAAVLGGFSHFQPIDGRDWNRVGAVDGRIVFGKSNLGF